MNKLYRELRAEARKLFKEYGAVITISTPGGISRDPVTGEEVVTPPGAVCKVLGVITGVDLKFWGLATVPPGEQQIVMAWTDTTGKEWEPKMNMTVSGGGRTYSITEIKPVIPDGGYGIVYKLRIKGL